jgi:hypothetical protein
VGIKEFNFTNSGELAPPVIIDSVYRFEIIDGLLVAMPSNSRQEVKNFIEVLWEGEKNKWDFNNYIDNLGYHVALFDSENIANAFRIYKGEQEYVTLPVFIQEEDIQLAGSHVIVERFGVPNSQLYLEFCRYFKIEADKEIIELLDKVYQTYS